MHSGLVGRRSWVEFNIWEVEFRQYYKSSSLNPSLSITAIAECTMGKI
ncbi:MAG: hypothetical protein PF541_02905 [Prolixibacteraceae bacterium]|nr:hypothetical protein [Prolixibacteraceae bacterium]